MIHQYEPLSKNVMLQLLEVVMLKASHYTWKSVRGFYAQVAQQVELCRLEFDDISAIREKASMFFRPSDLRMATNTGPNTWKPLTTNFTSGPDKSTQPKACRQWNYTASCTCVKDNPGYASNHKCRVCAKDHPMLHCSKRRSPIPDFKDA